MSPQALRPARQRPRASNPRPRPRDRDRVTKNARPDVAQALGLWERGVEARHQRPHGVGPSRDVAAGGQQGQRCDAIREIRRHHPGQAIAECMTDEMEPVTPSSPRRATRSSATRWRFTPGGTEGGGSIGWVRCSRGSRDDGPDQRNRPPAVRVKEVERHRRAPSGSTRRAACRLEPPRLVASVQAARGPAPGPRCGARPGCRCGRRIAPCQRCRRW